MSLLHDEFELYEHGLVFKLYFIWSFVLIRLF
jgi:hypothetical protein